mgnify:CR=1 FL=1
MEKLPLTCRCGKIHLGDNNICIGSECAEHLEGSGKVIIGYNVQPSSISVNKELKVGSDDTTWILGDSSGIVNIDNG